MLEKTILVTPIGKPRMTQRDKWAKRKCVVNYFAFKDEVRYQFKNPEEYLLQPHKVTFYIPMPKSWSKKKKSEMLMTPHDKKPDVDNLSKALNDAVLDDDSKIWSQWCEKYWSIDGCIKIEILHNGINNGIIEVE
jgi:Holliday junction resolvase RusA-like endonuclease